MQQIAHLSKDKKFKKVLEMQEPFILEKRKKVYLHLCYSIMSQQLSTKVADLFHRRFLNLYSGKEPTPQQISTTPFETLRGIGLSNAKANYVLNVSNFFIDEKITDVKLYRMSNEDVIKYLTQIKGVGQWTVEMILMFTLGREDVFAVDDLGIQMAVKNLYQLRINETKKLKKKMLVISESWSPYRTYACMYLWRWKDGKY